jgi:hypothetical protein
MLIGLDNKLVLTDLHGSLKEVLCTHNPDNFFWHITTAKDAIYVQEYGEPPTHIYRSIDGENWEAKVSSSDIDKHARHFHSIAYDRYRDMLVATLGDGNRVRIAISHNGEEWKPVYTGAWQTLPIAVLQDRIVFGMDSGIGRGGVLTWFLHDNKFETLHLRWNKKDIQFMQMADLKRLDNGIWLAALGSPQAIITSTNLEEWKLIHFEGCSASFSAAPAISEATDFVAFVTGKSLLYMKKADLVNYSSDIESVAFKHRATFEKLMGLGHSLKWRLKG